MFRNLGFGILQDFTRAHKQRRAGVEGESSPSSEAYIVKCVLAPPSEVGLPRRTPPEAFCRGARVLNSSGRLSSAGEASKPGRKL